MTRPLRADVILQGSLDLHAHGHPEFTLQMPPRVDNIEWARLAHMAGMRGFVVKSHVWPTTTTALMLCSLYSDLEVFGSITCNPPAGGINPVSVEIAAQTGAKIVWMPTWAALQDPPRPSIFRERMLPYVATLETDPEAAPSLTVLGEDGALSPDADRVLKICRAYDMSVATGHLPIASSMVLAKRAQELGVRLILTHPLSSSVGASIDDQRTIIEFGGMIEHVFIGCMPMHQRTDPARIVEAIEAVGPEHVVLSSDAIEGWNPPAPEVLRMFIASLLALGMGEETVYAMTHDNPARAIGVPSRRPPAAEDLSLSQDAAETSTGGGARLR